MAACHTGLDMAQSAVMTESTRPTGPAADTPPPRTPDTDTPQRPLPRKAAGRTTRSVADPDAWRTADETFPEPAVGEIDPGAG